MMNTRTIAALALGAAAAAASANPLMSAEYTAALCEAWNKTPTLTEGLGGPWIKNDAGRGHKIIQIYRSDCGDATRSELKIVAKDGKAVCAYGGKVQSPLNGDVDYLMHAETAHWLEMAAGQYGPMRAMMFGALKFTGPKMEAMSVMGPFEAFLTLPAKVSGDSKTCPAKS